MISVLCPSRGRTELLTRSIRSLLDTADDPSNIEVLVAADPDDTDTAIVAQDLGARVWMPSERLGYRRLHLYYNALAALALGEWILIWNDDATMATEGWDSRIMRHPDHVVETIKGICFPAIPAAWVRHVGHVALECHNDAWWEQIAVLLGRRVRTRMKGYHDNPDDKTSADARGKKKNPEFYGPENMALIRADVEKIKEIL